MRYTTSNGSWVDADPNGNINNSSLNWFDELNACCDCIISHRVLREGNKVFLEYGCDDCGYSEAELHEDDEN